MFQNWPKCTFQLKKLSIYERINKKGLRRFRNRCAAILVATGIRGRLL